MLEIIDQQKKISEGIAEQLSYCIDEVCDWKSIRFDAMELDGNYAISQGFSVCIGGEVEHRFADLRYYPFFEKAAFELHSLMREFNSEWVHAEVKVQSDGGISLKFKYK